MRIRRIALRNFRGVADTEVSLPPDGVTVIEGPNEVGKSSLAEAIDLILEHPDTSSKATVKAVKPVHLDEGAAVELELTTGDYRVVYTKRWHKHPQTTLRILAPGVENHTGRKAHEKMKEILGETLDVALWKALRYQQGTTIAQAALGDSLSLTSALDAAASGTALGGPDEANLWDQVEAERLRYVTAGGRLTTERVSLDRAVTQDSEQAARLRADLERLDAAAERHRRLTDQLRQAGTQLDGQRLLVETHTEAWEKLAAEQHRVDELAQSVTSTAAEASAAQLRYDERARLVDRARTAADAVHELEAVATREAPGLAAAYTAHTAAVELRDAARQARRDAEMASRLADEDYEYFRELMGLEMLRERRDRVRQAETTLDEATAYLERCPIDEDRLAEIEREYESALQTRARLTGESPAVRIHALRNLDLTVDDEHHALVGGGVLEARGSHGDLELTVDDLARITIPAGTATRELQDRAAEADQRLTELYRSVGVAGDDAHLQARSLEQRRRSAQRDAEQATGTLGDNLRDLTPQLLVEKIDRAEFSTTRYLAERACDTPLPGTREEAELRHRQATAALDQARQLEAQREDQLRGPTDALDAVRTAATERSVQIKMADQQRRSAEQELAVARASGSDDDLARRRAELAERAAAAQAAHQRAAGEFAARDPEGTQLILDNAHDVLTRIQQDSRSLADELMKVSTELEIKGEQGLHDQLDAVESRLVHSERDKAQRDRRAAAAQFLYERLAAHRDAAKRSYVRPFREQVEKLGRIVFGPSLSVELDHEDLQITSRTLAGVTIPYESLSTGAKEQLCVISRLACAALVNPRLPDSPERGAPVVIDDAFGYSDSSRLERLGAVLALAGRQSQVIVLTCTPERYRNIGSATVVRLEPESRGQ